MLHMARLTTQKQNDRPVNQILVCPELTLGSNNVLILTTPSSSSLLFKSSSSKLKKQSVRLRENRNFYLLLDVNVIVITSYNEIVRSDLDRTVSCTRFSNARIRAHTNVRALHDFNAQKSLHPCQMVMAREIGDIAGLKAKLNRIIH